MPFCTNCGHDNPDGSNFCAQCGSAAAVEHRRGRESTERAPTGDTTKTIPAMVDERDASPLTAEDEAAVNALPQGSALLIVQRGSNAGSRFLLNTDVGHRRPAPELRHLPRRHLGLPASTPPSPGPPTAPW